MKTDIEAMAREAGDDWGSSLQSDKDFLVRFASLARSQALEDAAVICDKRSADHWHDYKSPSSPMRGDLPAKASADEADASAAAIRAAKEAP